MQNYTASELLWILFVVQFLTYKNSNANDVRFYLKAETLIRVVVNIFFSISMVLFFQIHMAISQDLTHPQSEHETGLNGSKQYVIVESKRKHRGDVCTIPGLSISLRPRLHLARRRHDARHAHEPQLCTSHFVEPYVDFCPALANMCVYLVKIRIMCSVTSWT